jgi:hypothetical protein
VAGATVLTVEDPTDFDDEAGVVLLNDVQYTYSAGAVDDDAATITLDTGIAAEAFESDPVYTVAGGQILQDCILAVSCGDGDDVEVTVPFSQRNLWAEGDYDEPVQVLLSDDLERIEDVPGRTPEVTDAEIVGGTITGPVIRTAASGQRIELAYGTNGGALSFYNSSGAYIGQLWNYGGVGVVLQSPSLRARVLVDGSDDSTTVEGDTISLVGPVEFTDALLSGLNMGNHAITNASTVHSGGLFDDSLSGGGNGRAANFNDSGKLVPAGTSRRAIKDNIVPITEEQAAALLEITAYTFTMKEDAHLASPKVHAGYMVDDLAARPVLEPWVWRDRSGEPEAISYERVSAGHHVILQRHQCRIDELEAEKAAQQEQIDALAARLDALEAGS